MSNRITPSFKGDFEAIMDMIDKLIDACPDNLWNKKAGGFVFWQQLLHAVACVDFFAMRPGIPTQKINQDPDVIHLKTAPTGTMSKAELKTLSATMKQVGIAFMDSLSEDQLFAKHEALSQYFGKDINNLDGLTKILWHTSYHFGCCDAMLREEGLTGIF